MGKLTSSLLILSLYTISTYALEIGDVRVGATYYHNQMLGNKRVQVLKVYGNKVEVMYLEGDNQGEIDFVSASDLLSLSESRKEEQEDVAIAAAVGVIGIAAVYCWITEDCEGSPSSGTTSSGTTSRSYEFYITNNCREPIQLALTYHDGAWQTKSWWHFEPSQSYYLSSDNRRIKSSSGSFYYYAESLESSKTWGGTDHHVTVSGRSLAMHKIVDESGDNDLTLTCP